MLLYAGLSRNAVSLASIRIGKREYLNNVKNKDFMAAHDELFRSHIETPRIRQGKRQEIETLINEEAFLFAKSLSGFHRLFTL
jgi:hypothetical protein